MSPLGKLGPRKKGNPEFGDPSPTTGEGTKQVILIWKSACVGCSTMRRSTVTGHSAAAAAAAAAAAPPCLKYQLPHEDLDALFSLPTYHCCFSISDGKRKSFLPLLFHRQPIGATNLSSSANGNCDTTPIEPKVEPASQPSVPPVLDLPPVKTKMDVEQVQSITIEPI
ncbi:unnamed protein product, partial [Musa hybrid cultivar]